MRDKDERNHEALSPAQQNLIALITPVVEQHYQSSNLSKEDIESALKSNMDLVQQFMGTIMASITDIQNEKIQAAIDESDQQSYSPY